jgi:hypothetical protein
MCGATTKHNGSSYTRCSSSNNNKIHRTHVSNQSLIEISFTGATWTIYKEQLSFVLQHVIKYFLITSHLFCIKRINNF